MKKIISVLLILAMIFTLGACGKKEKEEEILYPTPEKKVAILTAPESQYPEDYKAAKEIAALYPETIELFEYPDSRVLKPGDPAIMEISREIAENEEFGAIIYARATQFTNEAIGAAKAINPGIVTLAIEPEQDVAKVAERADLVLCANWEKYCADIIKAAKKLGAEYFVYYSFKRHSSNNPLYSQIKGYLADGCKNNSIDFVYESSHDPNYTGGVEKANEFARASYDALVDSETISGTNVVLFTTDSSIQNTLIDVANEKGLIFISPTFPSLYSGIGEKFELPAPKSVYDEEFYEDTKFSVTDANCNLRYALYTYPLAAVLQKIALYSAFEILIGDNYATDEDLVAANVKKVTENKKLTFEMFHTVDRVFEFYFPAFEVPKQPKEKK